MAEATTGDQPRQQQLSVHRCRFVDYVPSAVTALAFPPLPLPRPRPRGGITRKKDVAEGSGSRTTRRRFGTLAVGRANGNIELCEWTGADYEVQSPQGWALWKILLGPNPSKVESLAFVIKHPEMLEDDCVPGPSDLRLLSAGGGSELVEWDLERGCVLRSISSRGGAIWSISVNPSSTLLALGCEDGCVRLISLADNALHHHRRFERAKCRVLSIAWGPPVLRQKQHFFAKTEATSLAKDEEADEEDEDEPEWNDSWLITGGSDSSLRRWDIGTGRVDQRMLVDRIRGERTLVWSVGVLGDGTMVSGDSLGSVRFWDSMTCTQLQSFQNHGADVLCIAIGPDGESIYTSGIDQKICYYTQVKLTKKDSDLLGSQDSTGSLFKPKDRWIHSTSKRMHSHDVRALAIWPPHVLLPRSHSTNSSRRGSARLHLNPNVAPILASGGLDMAIVLAPCATLSQSSASNQSSSSSSQSQSSNINNNTTMKIINPLVTSQISTFEDSYHCRMAYRTGLAPAIQVARLARLMICRRETRVSIWRILKEDKQKQSQQMPQYPYSMEGIGAKGDAGSFKMDIDVDMISDDEVVAKTKKARKRQKEKKRELKREQKQAEEQITEKDDIDGVEVGAAVGGGLGGGPGYRKLVEMELNTHTNLVASAISDDGRWLAVSDLYETKLFFLRDVNGQVQPERIENFTNMLRPQISSSSPSSPSPSSSSTQQATSSTGSSALGFSPDSSKLVMGMTFSSLVCIIDLGLKSQGGHEAPSLRFLRKFDQHRTGRGGNDYERMIKPLPRERSGLGMVDGDADADAEMKDVGKTVNGKVKINGHVNGRSGNDSDGSDEESDEDGGVVGTKKSGDEEEGTGVMVTNIAFSADGQWCATADDRCRTHVYNLDAIQYHCTVPSMPHQINALAFHSPPPIPIPLPNPTTTSPSFSSSSPSPFHSSFSRFSSPASVSSSFSTSPSCSILIFGLANNTMEIYDVETRRFPEWSRALCAEVPKRFTALHDGIVGIAVDVVSSISDSPSSSSPLLSMNGEQTETEPNNLNAQRNVYFWGSTWICQVTLDAPVGWGGFSKKRRRQKKELLNLNLRKSHHRNHHRKQQKSKSKSKLAQSFSADQNPDAQPRNDDQDADPDADPEDPMDVHIQDIKQRKEGSGGDDDNNNNDGTEMTNFKLVTRYRPILFADFIAPGEMVVVERPLLDVLAGLPPAYFKAKYGQG